MSASRWEGPLLATITAVLVTVGIVAVYGASSLLTTSGGQVGATFALRQGMGAVVGGVLAIAAARVDYRHWRRLAWPLVGVAALLLLVPLLPFARPIAPTINGARRWVDLGLVTVQPSEFAKFVIVVWTAMLAAKKGEQLRSFGRGMAPFLVILVPVVLMIFLEPHLSMALLVTLLAGTVLFAAGARLGHFLLLAAVALPAVYAGITRVGWRAARLDAFLNPDLPSAAGWQVHQSLVGIGQGRLFGVGLGQGQQKLGYLRYAYSDFIFSTIAEEWGFVGVLVLVLLFGVFIWVGVRIARAAPDAFGRLLAVGLTASVGISAVLHIGVSLGVVPATGLTLPFVSYGRSSLVVSLVTAGVLASVGHARGRGRGNGGRGRGAVGTGRAEAARA